MNTEIITEAPNNWWTPTFILVPWVNEQAVDYELLKNKPDVPVAYTLPNSSTTVKWWVKLATAPTSPTPPVAVGDNDPRLTKYFASWTATLTSGVSTSTISVWFTPSYVRINAVVNTSNWLLYTSWNKNASSNWIWFTFAWSSTIAYSSNFSIDLRSVWWLKYESTIVFATNQFVLSHNWSQFTIEIMWEAFA